MEYTVRVINFDDIRAMRGFDRQRDWLPLLSVGELTQDTAMYSISPDEAAPGFKCLFKAELLRRTHYPFRISMSWRSIDLFSSWPCPTAQGTHEVVVGSLPSGPLDLAFLVEEKVLRGAQMTFSLTSHDVRIWRDIKFAEGTMEYLYDF